MALGPSRRMMQIEMRMHLQPFIIVNMRQSTVRLVHEPHTACAEADRVTMESRCGRHDTSRHGAAAA